MEWNYWKLSHFSVRKVVLQPIISGALHKKDVCGGGGGNKLQFSDGQLQLSDREDMGV